MSETCYEPIDERLAALREARDRAMIALAAAAAAAEAEAEAAPSQAEREYSYTCHQYADAHRRCGGYVSWHFTLLAR